MTVNPTIHPMYQGLVKPTTVCLLLSQTQVSECPQNTGHDADCVYIAQDHDDDDDDDDDGDDGDDGDRGVVALFTGEGHDEARGDVATLTAEDHRPAW